MKIEASWKEHNRINIDLLTNACDAWIRSKQDIMAFLENIPYKG